MSGWSGPAAGTLDLSCTMVRRSRISLPSSMYARSPLSFQAGRILVDGDTDCSWLLSSSRVGSWENAGEAVGEGEPVDLDEYWSLSWDNEC